MEEKFLKFSCLIKESAKFKSEYGFVYGSDFS